MPGAAHGERAVAAAVGGVPSVTAVSVDLDRGTVTVEGQPDPVARRAAIANKGHEVVAVR